MNKKIKILLIILGLILLFFFLFIIRNKFVGVYNETFIEKYVAKNYPDYAIVDYSYLGYSDLLWEVEEDLEKDYINYEVYCDTLLQHKNTGMYISIPFYHDKYGFYKDSKYNKKNIKYLVNKYEVYWNAIQKIAEKHNIELKIASAIFTEASNYDISEVTIYFPTKVRNSKLIDDINNLNVDIEIGDINYVFVEENHYRELSPWIEPNTYISVLDGLSRVGKDDEYSVYIETYNMDGTYYELYYGIE